MHYQLCYGPSIFSAVTSAKTLFSHAMLSVMPALRTVLFQHQLTGHRIPGFGKRVIPLTTFPAFDSDANPVSSSHTDLRPTRQNPGGITTRVQETSPNRDHQLAIPAWDEKYSYPTMLLTTPAPTVRPPSRMAKRSPSSMAMGVINSTETVVLSPGIHISVPPGSVTTPVTSVVRK